MNIHRFHKILLKGALWVTMLSGPSGLWAHPITELQAPQCFIVDTTGDQYFIANANGEPGQADNNGFIAKLNREGEVVNLHFIQGGQGDTVLHSPNGLAMIGNTLYVADLDTIRGFHAITGAPTLTVSLRRFAIAELTDLAADTAGHLYALDTTGNAIYRIDTTQEHAVSLVIHDDRLAGPRGIAVHPKNGTLLVVSLDNGTVFAVTQQGTLQEIISNSFFTGRFQHLSGIDFDQYGSMYISDLTAGKIWRIRPDLKMNVIAEFLISPVSVRIDRAKHLILVPYLYANGAEMNGLERPVNVDQPMKKKRTLEDYGLGWLNGNKSP